MTELAYAEANAILDTADLQVDEVMRQAKENYEVFMYDAGVSRQQAFESRLSHNRAVKLQMFRTEQILADQTSKYAAAGVAVDQGTPVDVAWETAWAATNDMIAIKYEGSKEFMYHASLEDKYRLLADKTMEDAAAAAASIEKQAAIQHNLAILKAESYMEPVLHEAMPPSLSDLTPLQNAAGGNTSPNYQSGYTQASTQKSSSRDLYAR
jgi:hypothetical protein